MNKRSILEERVDAEAVGVNNPLGELYTTAAVGRIFGVTSETVRAWIQQGKLPAVRTPGKRGHLRVRYNDLKAFAEARFHNVD
jgi:excisionase family DNA binding protein